MRLTFLGTSSGTPTRTRNVSSLAMTRDGLPDLWLFDAGEGTQHRVQLAPVRLGRLRRIFVTHLHGDHVFGLPGLLASAGLLGVAGPITVAGPPGIARFVRGALEATHTGLPFTLDIVEVRPGDTMQDQGWTVRCGALAHRIPAFGWRVDGPPSWHLDPGRVEALGAPAGPWRRAWARGDDATLPDGRVVPAAAVATVRAGRSFVLCSDTRPCDGAVELARGAEVLVHEATYLEEHRALADGNGHSTARGAAEVARAAGVRDLILTHFSPRYEASQALVDEAAAVFPSVSAAADLAQAEVRADGLRWVG